VKHRERGRHGGIVKVPSMVWMAAEAQENDFASERAERGWYSMAWVIGGLAYFGLVAIMCLFFRGCSLRQFEEGAEGAMGNKRELYTLLPWEELCQNTLHESQKILNFREIENQFVLIVDMFVWIVGNCLNVKTRTAQKQNIFVENVKGNTMFF
jgi:hypothetical protein